MKYLKLFAIVFMMLFLASCDDEVNSITSAVVNNEGHLILTYEDGTIQDQGLVIPEVEVVEVEYHLVNFYNTEGYIISTQIVEHEEAAFAPTLVVPEHLTFEMWDATFDSITEDLNIHPIVSENVFTISFNNPEVSVPDMTGIQYGETVTLPNPQVEGLEFLGWFVDDSPYATMASMYGEVHHDMELYARYEQIVYTVTFHIDGDIETHTQEFFYGHWIGLSDFFTKEDYYFNGWYRYPNEIGPLDDEIEITEDMDIYASWIQFEYYFVDYYGYANDERIRIDGVIGDHDYVHIPSMIDGYAVEIIGANAFRYEEFYEVYLPNTVTHLYDNSFADMPNLTNIVLPDSLEAVGSRVFYNCVNLTDFNLPPNLQGVGSRMLENTAVESVVIPEGYEYIGYAAFKDTPLTSISIPDSLLTIGDSALENTLITELIIPEGVTTIGGFAFRDCKSLTTVSIPQSVASINDNPFAGATNLSSVNLNESNPNYEMIDDVIFNEAMNLLEVYLPYKSDTTYQVPDSVLYFDRHAVISNPYLEVLQLPDVLSSYYPSDNFYDMESLRSFEVYDAPGTTLITSEDGVIYNADFTILYNYPMGKTDTAYTLNAATIIVYTEAFEDNTYISSVILNNGIQRLYSGAFKNCTNLSAINFPTTLLYIYERAFYNVDGISSITLPNNILSVGYQSFAEMDNLSSLTLNEGITYLPSRLIENSNSVTSLHIPSTVNSLDSNFLTGSNGLSTLTISISNTVFNVYNNSIYSEDYSTLFAVPGGLNQENYHMAYETTHVYANFGTNPYIKIIEVYPNVVYFSAGVRDLPNLHALVFHNYTTVASFGQWPFDPSLDEGFRLYVRTALYDDYLANSNWSRFEEWLITFN